MTNSGSSGTPRTTSNHIEHTDEDLNSFILQQLNIFLQKPIGERWTSFNNLEMINSDSSFRGWGAFNLEEAWVHYRIGRAFNLKLGLQIPICNHFNEIKNKMPTRSTRCS